jgi:hypothetical protein
VKSARHVWGLILVLLSLTGCGESESTATREGTPQATAPDSVFDPMVQTIDQAKAVEDLSANRTTELEKELEKSQ